MVIKANSICLDNKRFGYQGSLIGYQGVRLLKRGNRLSRYILLYYDKVLVRKTREITIFHEHEWRSPKFVCKVRTRYVCSIYVCVCSEQILRSEDEKQFTWPTNYKFDRDRFLSILKTSNLLKHLRWSSSQRQHWNFFSYSKMVHVFLNLC